MLTVEKQKRLKHGAVVGGPTRLYRIWLNLRHRCNSTRPRYKNYNGRGIDYDKRWDDFMVFAEEMSDYEDGKEIDRIDNNRGYFRDNVRWVDRKTNLRNTRRTHFLTFNGETRCVREWSEVTGINELTLHHRLRFGWSVEDTLTKPVKHKRKLAIDAYLVAKGEGK